ncbi:MAG: hypothetical protein HOV83_21435, partial [Catenulispora sp.]|nr:hypothetical protein [Catenulispora sp.]
LTRILAGRRAWRRQPRPQAPGGSPALPPGPHPSASGPTIATSTSAIPLPTDVTWAAVAGVELPYSASAGPRVTAGGRAAGFSANRAGAVFAAIHLVVRTSPRVGPDVFGPTVREQVYGPDRSALADQVNADYADARDRQQVPYGQPLAPAFAQVTGVRVDFFDGTAATVRLLMRLPGPHGDPVYVSSTLQVSFVDGDWRLMAPPRGDWATVRTEVPASAASDYTPLPGRS